MRHSKHLTRYLLGTRGMHVSFPRDKRAIDEIIVYCDSDWASASIEGRKSISAGIMFVNGCCLGSWSRGQSVTAMSSGEAEYYAILLAATEGVGLQSILKEIGHEVKVTVLSDSSAARAMCVRLGAGGLKHVETRFVMLCDEDGDDRQGFWRLERCRSWHKTRHISGSSTASTSCRTCA